jgi:hypothetical protein
MTRSAEASTKCAAISTIAKKYNELAVKFDRPRYDEPSDAEREQALGLIRTKRC